MVVLAEISNDAPESFAGLWVKAGGRFVENENFWLMNDGSCNIDAATLTARKFTNGAAKEVFKIKNFCKFS